jgi:hypothetical protein
VLRSLNGEIAAIAVGTESSDASDGSAPAKRVSSVSKLTCLMCKKVGKASSIRHHSAYHIENPGDDLLCNFPCGMCAMNPSVPYTVDHHSVMGCTLGLESTPSSVRVIGRCKLVGDLSDAFGSYKCAGKCTKNSPSTSIPLVCPLCPHKKGFCSAHLGAQCCCTHSERSGSTPVVHWAHNMKAHWAKAHPTTVMPQDLERVLKRKISIDGVDDGVSEIELLLRCSWVLLN